MSESNPILKSAIDWKFSPFELETGLDRIVAYGDQSGKCPTYVERTPPCSDGCPAGEDIRGYHNIIRGVWKAEDPWSAAFERLTRTNPFPGVMGRVCPAPCESACNRQYRDETVGINAVEQAIGDYAREKKLALPTPPDSTGKRVVIVGSGPAGLSCAYHLRMQGHGVTIVERDPKLGGMMRYGIMGYRVSRQVLDQEIQRILDLDVEIKTGVKVGEDVTLADLREQYDAVFLAVGAQKGRGIPIPGADGAGVTNAIEFLRSYELDNDNHQVGKHVVVIGDGDVAMDAARLALRRGSKATLLCGVAREEMNASQIEFDEAKVEGTDMKFLTGSVEVIRDAAGNMTGVKCIRMIRKEKGEDGWNHKVPFFRYKPEPDSEFELQADMLVAAIGQTTDMTGLDAATDNSPSLAVDYNMQIKGMADVFGGGDAVQIHLLTTAIGHGRKAAGNIGLFLDNKPLPKRSRAEIIKYEKLKSDFFINQESPKRSLRHIQKVEGDWDETLVALSQEDATKQSARCMSCGMCFECNQCLLYCPQEAIVKHRNNPEGEVMYTEYDRCVGCHICAEVCPTGYIDMGMGA
jgi:NADPH-dependent glutamate synthase beta subunit-like oxidoreductase/Pyruvate/2-oxoacid:ferredoxin oxidoreductase delta subunit